MIRLGRCSLCFFAAALLSGAAHATPTIWTGLTHSFSKSATADPTLPANQDRITDRVILTRGPSGGIYNVVSETFSDITVSPADTRWATDIHNPGKSISATNWDDLFFENWSAAYGGQVGMTIVNRDAVLHLITDDIYLDVRFTAWGMGGGGGGGGGGSFSYLRSDPPAILTTGDYNLNGAVDAADYIVWRKTFGESVSPGDGADGNANGTIDDGDYTFWIGCFGEIVSNSAVFAEVPEPLTLFVFALGSCLVASRCRFR